MTTAARTTRRSTRRALSDSVGPTPDSAAAESEPADPESVARSLVLRRLTTSPATRAQLAELLASRGVPDETADYVLTRFQEVGLINDAAFADLWVQSRQRGRGLARRALRQELLRRGVESEVVETSLEQVSPDDERESARTLVRRRLAATASVEHQARVRRLVSMLARRGYSQSLAVAVVLEELSAQGAQSLGEHHPDTDYSD